MSIKSFRSLDTGFSRERRARVAWLKSDIAAAVCDGHMPTEERAALPAHVRNIARSLAERGVAAHERGERPQARQFAEELVAEIDDMLDDKWQPPREKPDRDLLDEIQGLNR